MIDPHAAWADLNAGELGSMPLPGVRRSSAPLPENVGSGKLDTPCERMHCENWSARFRWPADGGPDLPPFGSFEWHACSPDLNAGELTATPLTDVPPFVCCTLSPPLMSGKFGTPCARMHSENAMKLACFPATACEAAFVALFEFDEPPHAASAMLVPATRVIKLMARMLEWYETTGYSSETGAVTRA